MIFPKVFPKKDHYSKAEEKIFNALSKLADEDFTIFYNQEFTGVRPNESSEYEIDFIIADHRNGVLKNIFVVEAKGGNIKYDGTLKEWYQNGKKMDKAPNFQATSAMHSLINRFGFIAKNVNFDWVLWFPDVEIRENEWLPTLISKDRLLDAKALTYTSEQLLFLGDKLSAKNQRQGAPMSDFEKFKNTLLRSVGFFKPLHKSFEDNENLFKTLTDQQTKIFKRIDLNPNICVQGPAGSGKTVIAFNKAILFAEQGLKVMYVSFNRNLATELRRKARKLDLHTDTPPLFVNFHYWASNLAESNPTFNKEKSSEYYYNTYIPNKAKEMITEPEYDVIIIDEGQDFRENWIELLNKILKKEGRFLFFMDENQDIFHAFNGVPNHRNILKYELDENCRNTKNIIEKLNEILPNVNMTPMEATPEGLPVKYYTVKNHEEQVLLLDKKITKLLEQQIQPNQIVILTNNEGRISSLKGVNMLGQKKLISTYDKEFGLDNNCIAQATINVFKGLEADVIFILDAQNIHSPNQLYTQISRAKQLIYIISVQP